MPQPPLVFHDLDTFERALASHFCKQGLASFFGQGPGSKYLQLCRPRDLWGGSSALLSSTEAARDDM